MSSAVSGYAELLHAERWRDLEHLLWRPTRGSGLLRGQDWSLPNCGTQQFKVTAAGGVVINSGLTAVSCGAGTANPTTLCCHQRHRDALLGEWERASHGDSLMKRFSDILASGLASLIVRPALAQNCASYPFTLTNGTTADANQVMSNFNAIRNCVNATVVSNPVPVSQGGTGATIPSAAAVNLGVLQIRTISPMSARPLRRRPTSACSRRPTTCPTSVAHRLR